LDASSLQLFAACPRGVVDLLAEELRGLGADVGRSHPAGVSFDGDLRIAYSACLWSRVASRIVLTLAEVDARDDAGFYAAVRALPWERQLPAGATLAIDVVGDLPPWLRHSGFAAQRCKDAVVDRLRELRGERASVDLRAPDVRISLRFGGARASLGIDLSGEPLHRRGYRLDEIAAPLKENLAAAILLRSGWPSLAERGAGLLDPMCGSGTLPIEAAWIAADVAPGLLRSRFGFERWGGHDASLWQDLRAAALARRRIGALAPGRIEGADRDPGAIRAAQANATRAGLAGHLNFVLREVTRTPRATTGHGLVVVNPPYGARLGDAEALRTTYAELGRTLLESHAGWEAAVFTGNPPLARDLGLDAYRSHTLYNGPIECRLLRFRLTQASVPVDREVARAARLEAARARPGAVMFANRLRKNLAEMGKWATREGVACFRIYDADMPEYAFAIDLYGNDAQHAFVQEYAAPPTVNEEKARGRRDEVRAVLPETLALPAERIHLRTRRRQRGGSQYEKLAERGEFHVVREGRYRFQVNFDDYLDTGLFLDHRLTRERIGALASGRRFLNLFAYTGTATVHAIGGGAVASTTVDMSRTYLDWARRNLELNGLAGAAHEFVQADCLTWLEEAARQRRTRYGLIFVDPPTLSRSKRMAGEFDVQRDHARLLRSVAALLEPAGEIVFSNNFRRFRLDDGLRAEFAVEDLTRATIPRDFARDPKVHCCFLLRRLGCGG
jgi:23S rRNA (guanine2445-N2)-methyltransferase / 23S rRNA (guanine2069-N7)-methyltransferase